MAASPFAGPTARVLAFTPGRRDVPETMSESGRHRVLYVSSLPDFCTGLRKSPDLVVCSCRSDNPKALLGVAAALADRPGATPAMLQLECGQAIYDALVAISRIEPVVHLSLCGMDACEDDLRKFVAGAHIGSHAAIIRGLPGTNRPAVDIVCRAIFASTRRCSAAAFEWRLAAMGLPEPRVLLARLFCLHALWALDQTDISVKSLATRSGFTSATTLCGYVNRCTGRTPKRLLENGGFGTLLSQFSLGEAGLAANGAVPNHVVGRGIQQPIPGGGEQSGAHQERSEGREWRTGRTQAYKASI